MSLYADSSFLVSCYVTDANTVDAKSYLIRTVKPIFFTALHGLEVRNALKLGVFRGLFAVADANAAWRNLESDLRNGRLVKRSVSWTLVFRVAARFSDLYSATVGTRSLDIIHIATAKTLRLDEFVSFDDRQRKLAVKVGLKVVP